MEEDLRISAFTLIDKIATITPSSTIGGNNPPNTANPKVTIITTTDRIVTRLRQAKSEIAIIDDIYSVIPPHNAQRVPVH